MLSSEEKKKAITAVRELKAEITALRDKLNEADAIKEDLFEKREQISKDISKRIHENIQLKKQRDELTAKVKEAKAERDAVNDKINALSNELEILENKKKEVIEKNNIQVDPSELMRQIKRLEERIETEAMSFDAEKKVMKQIKVIKKKYSETRALTEVMERRAGALKEIKQLRKKAKETHLKVQDLAKESQAKHESMLEASKVIDEAKAKEAELNEKFMDAKKKFSEINSGLKEKLGPLNELSQKLGEDYAETRAEMKRHDEETLKKKEEGIREKIRKREKLTTEDLLVYQNMSAKDKG